MKKIFLVIITLLLSACVLVACELNESTGTGDSEQSTTAGKAESAEATATASGSTGETSVESESIPTDPTETDPPTLWDGEITMEPIISGTMETLSDINPDETEFESGANEIDPEQEFDDLGNCIRKTVYEYDANGNKVVRYVCERAFDAKTLVAEKITAYHDTGKVFYTVNTEYVYDKQGRMVKSVSVTEWNDAANTYSKEIYTWTYFDKTGEDVEIQRYTEYNADGDIVRAFTVWYDREGNIIQEEHYDNSSATTESHPDTDEPVSQEPNESTLEGSETSTEEYDTAEPETELPSNCQIHEVVERDGQDRVIKEILWTYYETPGVWEHKQINEYTYDGDILFKALFTAYSPGDIIIDASERYFDENENVIKEIRFEYEDDGSFSKREEFENEYGDDGRITKKTYTFYRADGSKQYVTIYELGLNGEEIKTTQYDYNEAQILTHKSVRDNTTGKYVFTYYTDSGVLSMIQEGCSIASEDGTYTTVYSHFDENGQIYEKEERTFISSEQESERIIKSIHTEYDEDGDILSSYEERYEYDASGNKIKYTVTYYDADGNVTGSGETFYEYGKDGEITKQYYIDYRADGQTSWEALELYDADKYVRRDTYFDYDDNGTLVGKNTDERHYPYGWGDKQYHLEIGIIYENGTEKEKYISEYFYRQDGTLEKETFTRYENGVLDSEWTTEYDEMGRETKEISIAEGGSLHIKWNKAIATFSHDENGHVTQTISQYYDKDGKIVAEKTTTYSYNQNGELDCYYSVLKDADNVAIEEGMWRYDYFGLTQRPLQYILKRYVNGDLSESTEQNYTYYSNGDLKQEKGNYFYAEECYSDATAGYVEYKVDYNENGDTVFSSSHRYDLEKNLTAYSLTQSIYSDDGKLVEETDNFFYEEYGYTSYADEYDESERIIKRTITRHSTDYSFISHHVDEYYYDDNGNIIKESTVEYDANGNVIRSYDTEY
ncbi:MAG: hypothetical protein IJX74_03595 [Clostridia bacterium]|nr:hypothetical protein [Clostridia bacterium]